MEFVVTVAVVVAFFLCWAPFHAQRLMTVYVKEDQWTSTLLEIQSVLFYISGVLYFVSSTVNPILYNLMSRKYRQAFKDTLCRCLIPRSQRPPWGRRGTDGRSRYYTDRSTYSTYMPHGPHSSHRAAAQAAANSKPAPEAPVKNGARQGGWKSYWKSRLLRENGRMANGGGYKAELEMDNLVGGGQLRHIGDASQGTML